MSVSAMFFPFAVAVVGDRVTLPGVADQFCKPRCDGPALMFGCLGCRQPLANWCQFDFHLEAQPDTTHVVARLCLEHGWEAL